MMLRLKAAANGLITAAAVNHAGLDWTGAAAADPAEFVVKGIWAATRTGGFAQTAAQRFHYKGRQLGM